MAPQLCEVCQSINFRSLLFEVSVAEPVPAPVPEDWDGSVDDDPDAFSPSTIDLAPTSDKQSSSDDCGVRSASPSSVEISIRQLPESLPLGHLEDLIRPSSSCQFCALIVDAATKINGGNELPTITASFSFEGKPVECFRKSFFCTLRDATYEGKARRHVNIHRLNVDLDCFDEGYWKYRFINFQPYGEDIPGVDEVNDFTGMGRFMTASADVQRLRGWVHQCEDLHGDDCHIPKWLGDIKQPDFLKVIDVEKRCIVDAPPECR